MMNSKIKITCKERDGVTEIKIYPSCGKADGCDSQTEAPDELPFGGGRKITDSVVAQEVLDALVIEAAARSNDAGVAADLVYAEMSKLGYMPCDFDILCDNPSPAPEPDCAEKLRRERTVPKNVEKDPDGDYVWNPFERHECEYRANCRAHGSECIKYYLERNTYHAEND